MLLYYYLKAAINCFSIFFGLIFEINLESFQKIQVLKIDIIIFLKDIISNLTIDFLK